MPDVTCPECNGPVQVWSDNSDGITVNFACDNPKCESGKPPWDTPRPSDVTVEDLEDAERELNPDWDVS